MCLQVVNLTKKSVKNGQVVSKGGRFVGYKSFSVYISQIYNEETEKYEDYKEEIKPGLLKKMPKIGQWITSHNSVLDEDGPEYTSGFHIFTDRGDAEEYNGEDSAIFEVEFEDICAVGKQTDDDNGLTIIAKKMKLLKRIR